MITNTYKTEAECAELFLNERFDAFPALELSNKFPSWYEEWVFEGIMDFEDTDDEEEIDTYGNTHEPMWGTWFIPNWLVADWIIDHKEEVAKCGFTLIFDADDYSLFAIGVDGAGYSFMDQHWIPLYRAYGCKWHDEESKED